MILSPSIISIMTFNVTTIRVMTLSITTNSIAKHRTTTLSAIIILYNVYKHNKILYNSQTGTLNRIFMFYLAFCLCKGDVIMTIVILLKVGAPQMDFGNEERRPTMKLKPQQYEKK